MDKTTKFLLISFVKFEAQLGGANFLGLTLSSRAWVAFAKQSDYNVPGANITYEGDAIPGIGIIVGHGSNCKFSQ
jgi:hypothetical protein